MDTTQLVEQLKPMFEKVAEKIGTGAEFGWEVILRQQFAYGIANVMLAIAFMIGLYFLIKILKYCLKMKKSLAEQGNHYNDWGIGVGVSAIVSFFLSFGIVVSLYEAILRLYNPAFYVLEFLMGIIK